jgi:sec-independent protein translocase protein TatB
MFNMTGSEVMFLLIIGLVVLGPEKLPDAIRRMGKLYAELKRMSSGVQTDFRKVMDEPMKEMMSTTNSMKALFTDTAGEFQSAAKEIIEPTFIPYDDGSNITKTQDSLQSGTGQQNNKGTASTAVVEQQRKEDTSKHSEVNRMEYNDDEQDAISDEPKLHELTTKKLPAKKQAKKSAKTPAKTAAAKKAGVKKSVTKKSGAKKKPANGN